MDKFYQIVAINVRSTKKSLRYDPDNHGDEMITGEYKEAEDAIKFAEDEWHYLDRRDKPNKIMEVREVIKDEELEDGFYLYEYNTVWSSKYPDLIKEFGSIEWEGQKLALTQKAFLSGTRERPYYKALAEDMAGDWYNVIWSIIPEWWDGDREDEGDACNWDKPIGVHKF